MSNANAIEIVSKTTGIGYSGRAVLEFHQSSLFPQPIEHVAAAPPNVGPKVKRVGADCQPFFRFLGTMPQLQIVLPARLASTRLSEKLLQKVAGKSVLQHTYLAASQAACATAGVIVAVDDPRIADEVESFGGRWIMTPTDCPSGTDRIAFVAAHFPSTEIFVNVQSDEPEIDPAAIDQVAETLAADPAADIATAGTPIRSVDCLSDPGIVKIVMADFRAGQGRAVYFSRACVPFFRDGDPAPLLDQDPPVYWHHLGLYAYRRDFLSWFAQAPPSVLEKTEKLEQLRAIEAGKKIVVAAVGPARSGIDTAQDLAAFRRRLES